MAHGGQQGPLSQETRALPRALGSMSWIRSLSLKSSILTEFWLCKSSGGKPGILALRRWKLEDQGFEANLDCINPVFKNNNKWRDIKIFGNFCPDILVLTCPFCDQFDTVKTFWMAESLVSMKMGVSGNQDRWTFTLVCPAFSISYLLLALIWLGPRKTSGSCYSPYPLPALLWDRHFLCSLGWPRAQYLDQVGLSRTWWLLSPKYWG